jgi:N-acetylglucosaminyldiphosphoundecaprenol N-acetyl-beta-D-mannosaminyltransferase
MAVDVMLAEAPLVTVPDVSSRGTTDLPRPRVDFAGTRVDQLSLSSAMERIEAFIDAETPRCHQIVTVNLDFLSIAGRNAEFRDTINRADLAVADGMPLVWLSRLMGQSIPERVTGNELVAECCALAAETGRSIFMLGAADGVAAAAAETLRERFPGLTIAGIYSPPFGPLSTDENARIVDMINAAKPSFLFVALGAPRQDIWIRQHMHELEVPVAMGVGCVLDLLAGNVQRAPQWMQQSGLEWTYRMVQEPQRLWRRYILDDIPTLGRLAWNALRQTEPSVAALRTSAENPPA